MGKNRSGEFTREGGEIPCVELSGVELSVQGISGREKIMGEYVWWGIFSSTITVINDVSNKVSDNFYVYHRAVQSNLTELFYLNHHIR